MRVPLNSLISLEQLVSDVPYVLDVVNKKGTVVILHDNKPAYIISKYEEGEDEMRIPLFNRASEDDQPYYKLHEAMKIVLDEQPDKTMHAADLADEIYRRKLYLKKNGSKAESSQIRARCANYNHMFESLHKNKIRLI